MGQAARFKSAWWLSCCCLFLLLQLLPRPVSSASKPEIHRSWFGDALSDILYFDDSDVLLVTDQKSGEVWRSSDAGVKWHVVSELGKEEVFGVVMNPWSKKVAVALGKNQKHWITDDQGEHWREFRVDGNPTTQTAPPLSFHSGDEKKIIMNTWTRQGQRQAIYTVNGFEKFDVLRKDGLHCLWAKEQEHFDYQDKHVNKDRTLCIAFGKNSPHALEQRLVMSNDFFKSDEEEPGLEDNRPVPGMVSMVSAKAFILAARKAEGTDEMALYVTTDTKKWHRASFGGYQIQERGYTVMESTNYSLQIDVSTTRRGAPAIGSLFTSNSQGYSFVQNEKYTNRNLRGIVDFEKVTNIQGVVLVNTVANAEAVRETGEKKKVQSQISFNDGRTFFDLTVDGKTLHLHSMTEQNNVGKVFSSMAPGIVMGIGNTGEQLKAYGEGNLYVSDDAGHTWRLALEGSHKYEIGDQGSVLVAIPDSSPTSKLYYSLDHGKEWEKIDLKDFKLDGDSEDKEIIPSSLSTLPDSTSLKFHLKAGAGRGTEINHYIYTIDFDALDLKRCKNDDFEDWFVRLNKNEKPRCLMGHTQMFRRRKADAKCFIGKKFIDPKSVNEDCSCKPWDYECEEGFVRSKDKKTCEPLKPREPPAGACKGTDITFEDISGFRIIPGNTCKKNEDADRDREKKVQRKCSENKGSAPPNGKIGTTIRPFEADRFWAYFYLERSESSDGDDETVIALTNAREVSISHDHGKTWGKPKNVNSPIVGVYPHKYFKDQVYLITPDKTAYYSKDRGKTFYEFTVPGIANDASIPVLQFHPKNSDWLIWTSCIDRRLSGSVCEPEAYVTKKNGAQGTWTLLKKSVRTCEFVWRESRKNVDPSLIFCMQHRAENPKAPLDLLSSKDSFETDKVLFKDMINFATMSEYIVVAVKEGQKSQFLNVDTSLDGETFAGAKLPKNLKVHHSSAYTVLDSSTHAIFLQVTTSSTRGQEFGTIVKSNSNGTSYTMSLKDVNRNEAGYVDFEKLLSLEGVAVANVVTNAEEVKTGANHKKSKTMITHDDGATWNLISPPKEDADKKPYKCGKNREKCALHLHGYTERVDPRDTYSSPAAVGIMLGVGNVGEFLVPKRDCDTFISNDGGVVWKAVKKGQYMWEFGDRGAVIVIVEESVATNIVHYSRDEGETWTAYKFSAEEMIITDITTVPSDTSRNFLLWAKEAGSGGKIATINLDFSTLAPRKCELVDKPGVKKSDYRLWEPKTPDDGRKKNCLFGHVSQYIRKKPESDCYNPPNFGDTLHMIKSNCTCTRQDFECDYNFERKNDGSCGLVPGHRPQDPKIQCEKDPDLVEYKEVTGYRKLQLSTCHGGKELDQAKVHPCAGKEEDFTKEHPGMSGAGLFFAIVIPVGAAAAVGWWMWRNLDGRFGRIRLGDGGSPVGNGSGRGNKLLVKYPVMIISGIVAVAMAVPMVLGVLWRGIRERIPGRRKSYYSTYGRETPYTSRDSFSRAGRDYSDGPHNDERDLLGEDSDEDI